MSDRSSDNCSASRWRGRTRLAALCLLAFPSIAWSSYDVLYDGNDGVTCQYFNAGVKIAWLNRGGDWIDARGRLHGDEPYARVFIRDLDKRQTIDIDLTDLGRAKLKQGSRSIDLLLRSLPGNEGGAIPVMSREASDAESRPQLVFSGKGKTVVQPAEADATIDCTTYKSLGKQGTLNLGNRSVVLRFPIPEGLGPDLISAHLRLFTGEKQYGSTELGVYQVAGAESGERRKVELGIAYPFVHDRGLNDDPAVYFTEGFDTWSWRRRWTHAWGEDIDATLDDPALEFQPLDGRALRVNLAKGKNGALDLRYQFSKAIGHEPEEVYFRYYLRLANDWDPSVDGGKLPGISGTYDRGGWGGRRSDGRNGWSTRGEFFKAPEKENPAHGLTAIGTYAYHADQGDLWGDAWPWTATALGVLERNRWYCIEQHVRLNSPGQHDGVFRAWIDGKLAFERAGIRFRDIPELAIEMIWVNVYHGGQTPSPHDQHLYIDNIVIAREYIGPMGDK